MGLGNRLHPERYHGFTAHPPFFEGWYFKLVSRDGSHRLAIIPGVYLREDQEKRHAFIQVFDSESEAGAYIRYPFEDFKASPNSFEVMIGPNYFSAEQIKLDIEDENISVRGMLNFNELTPWPVRLTSVGAMGWFAWVQFILGAFVCLLNQTSENFEPGLFQELIPVSQAGCLAGTGFNDPAIFHQMHMSQRDG